MGLWLLQECPARLGRPTTWPTLLDEAAAAPRVRARRRRRTPPSSCRPATCRRASSEACRATGQAPPATRGDDGPLHPGEPRAGVPPDRRLAAELSGPPGRRGARRRRRRAQRAALPAHRRRLRPARAGRARSRPPPSATCSCRPARWAPTCRTSRRCARWSRRPTTCGATSRRGTRTGGRPPSPAFPPSCQAATLLGRRQRLTARGRGIRMRVALMVTCVNDAMFPETGKAVVRLLRRLGVDVDFPAGQTCCAQPMVNTGYLDEAVPVVRTFTEAFAGYDAVVTPCGLVRRIGPAPARDRRAALGRPGAAGRGRARRRRRSTSSRSSSSTCSGSRTSARTTRTP